MRRALLLLLIVPTFGFQCEYFDEVVVPATDTNPPILANRMWIGGVEQVTLSPVYEVVDGTQTSIAVFPAMIDAGGAQRLTVDQRVSVYCRDDDLQPAVGQISELAFFPKTTSQSGTVGSTVRNGLFLAGDVTDLASYEGLCESGFDLLEVTYEWSMVGRDFAGNTASLEDNMIIYEP